MEKLVKHRWFVRVAAAGFCLVLTVSAGWLWHAFSDEVYEAHARIALPNAVAGESPAEAEDIVLSPEVLAAAAELLHDRQISLSLASPFDSAAEYLRERVRIEAPHADAPDEVRIVCTAPVAEEALQVLTALLDACLESAGHRESPAESPGAGEIEGERRQLTQAIERQELVLAELTSEVKAKGEDVENGRAGEETVVSEGDLSAARHAISEAERRLADVRRDFEKKLPPEVVAARLAEGPMRTRILERLNQIKLKDDLQRHEALAEKWSKVYGRNHPRMAEIRGQIDELHERLSGFQGDAGEFENSIPTADPCLLVLDVLEADLVALQAAEREIETRLASQSARLSAQQELETQLGETRQELQFLYGEHNRLRQQIDNARKRRVGRVPDVIEQPALAADALAPQAGFRMAVSGGLGVALYFVMVWKLRARPRAARPRAAGNPASIAPRRERFRSQEEKQLARLKSAMRPEVASA